jgi:hypothetical protein
MNAWPELQRRFQRAVLAGDPAPGLFAAETAGAGGGFGIYLAAYRARLTAALRENFTVLQRALGDQAFANLARDYIDTHPSRSRSIRFFGDELSAFLDASPGKLPHPALADVARMDWAIRGAFDAADAPPLTLSDLAALPAEAWAEQRFRLLPSLRLVDLKWNVEPIWRALDDDAEAQTAAPAALPHVLLVWRPQLDCRWRSLDAVEATALRALAGGASFAACCTAIAASGAADPARVAAGLLRRWVVDGLLARTCGNSDGRDGR